MPPVRIVHTADNHLGLAFQRYAGEPEVRARLVAERIEALKRLVAEANRRQAHFFVVAGDLFDRPTVAKRDIKDTVDALATFSGDVLVLPGNHDFYEGPQSQLWKTFEEAVGNRAIRALVRPEVAAFEVDGEHVRFYPCPCPSKHGTESLIGWVRDAAKEPGVIHVGIAHGNVDGLGLDAEGRYFTMRQEELRAAGVATWLLGHIHVPDPAPDAGGSPAFFMPGIHTPDSVKCRHPGHAWYLEVEADGVNRFEQLSTGGVRFTRLSKTLRTAADVEALGQACAALPAADTVLDLQLTGRLKAADRAALEAVMAGLKEQFFSVTDDASIEHELDAEMLAAEYPTDSLQHTLLARLLGDEQHADAAWLAHQLFRDLGT